MAIVATIEQIKSVLLSPDFTEGEKYVVRMQFRKAIQAGNFEEKLWELLCAADQENLARLDKAFPDHVAGFRHWTYGRLSDRIRAAGCPI